MRRLLALAVAGGLWLGLAQPLYAQPDAQPEHIVRAGDTLLAIALHYHTTVQELMQLNGLTNPDFIQVGQRLRLPSSPMTKAAPVHIVQPGDTLLAIALRYRTTIPALMQLNGLTNPDVIRVGQRIRLPAGSPTPPPVVSPPALPPSPSVSLPPATDDLAAMRAALLAHHNRARLANGVSPLSYSPLLEQAAQAHAEDCARRGWCSHIGSDGSRASQRIARAGHQGRFTGENWAWSRSADKAFAMWYEDELPDGPHVRNILSPRYDEVGFGIAPHPQGGFFFVTNFASR